MINMARQKIQYTDHYKAVMDSLTGAGLLLGSYDAAGKANLMTIGWGSLGVVWGVPVWTILVRPSRHSYNCIEHSGCFTVNVPTHLMAFECITCGSKSGRDIDKFVECELTAEKSAHVLAPSIAECPIVYECQVVHSSDILPKKLADEILVGPYIDGDFHRVYWGKILGAYAEPNAEELIKG